MQVKQQYPIGLLPYTEIGQYRVHYYDSVSALHAAANMGYSGGGTYPNMDERRPSRYTHWQDYRFDWDEWNHAGLTLKGLEDDIAEINRIAESITTECQPAGLSYHRKMRWKASGVSLNVNRILRGQFNTAWRKPVREKRTSDSGIVSIVMSAAYGWRMEKNYPRWASIAVAALATYLENAGRQCEIYTSGVSSETYTTSPRHEILLVRIKAAGEAWNIQNIVLPVQQEYFRRWSFEIREQGGTTNTNYGLASMNYERETTEIMQAIGIDNTNILFGPNVDSGNVGNKEQAVEWLNNKIQSILAQD